MTAPDIVAKWSTWTPRLQIMLRIVAAFMFMLAGTMKLFAFPVGVPPDGGTVPLMPQMGIGSLVDSHDLASLIPARGLGPREIAGARGADTRGARDTGSPGARGAPEVRITPTGAPRRGKAPRQFSDRAQMLLQGLPCPRVRVRPGVCVGHGPTPPGRRQPFGAPSHGERGVLDGLCDPARGSFVASVGPYLYPKIAA